MSIDVSSSVKELSSVVLESDGSEFRGWETISIAKSIQSLAATFNFSATELEPDDPLLRQLKNGSRSTIKLDDDVVLDGFIYNVTTQYRSDAHSIRVQGADFSMDLEHCSADREPGSWKNQKIESITGDLISKFENSYLIDGDDTGQPLEKFSIKTGESVQQAISRAARLSGLILVGDSLGGIQFRNEHNLIAPTSINRNDFGFGRIKAATLSDDATNRFQTYRILGQTDSVEASELLAAWGEASGPPQVATSSDPGVTRYRPKILVESSNATRGRLAKRALIEASTRAARSKTVGYVLDGWRSANGWLWTPGYLVSVFDPLLAIGSPSGVVRELLITNVGFTVSANGGQQSTLKLMDPVAFTLLPLPPPKKNAVALWE